MNNPPAFPSLHWVAPKGHSANENPQGMTLRDYFAAKAMQGLVTASHNDGGCVKCDDKYIAPLAYEIADEMMEAREA